MSNYIIHDNYVIWDEMHICKKKNQFDLQNCKCDFELNNGIPSCIYKGPNTAVHLALVKVSDILNVLEENVSKSEEFRDKNIKIKSCIIFIFTKLSIAEIDKLDNKLQSLRNIEKNEKKINHWKKDYNFQSEDDVTESTNLKRYFCNGYISKHGYYILPISFRECEIISHPKIKKLLNKYNDYNLLMLLEHKKNNSKPYGCWDYSSIGGGTMDPESSIESIIRETYEESGILLNKSKIKLITKLMMPPNKELKIENNNTIDIYSYFL